MKKIDLLIQELATEFKLDRSIFNLDITDRKIVYEDIELKYFEPVKITNSIFNSYQYKQKESKHWKSIILTFDYRVLDKFLNIFNNILIRLNEVSISNMEINDSIKNSGNYSKDYNNEGILYLLSHISNSECFIDVAKFD